MEPTFRQVQEAKKATVQRAIQLRAQELEHAGTVSSETEKKEKLRMWTRSRQSGSSQTIRASQDLQRCHSLGRCLQHKDWKTQQTSPRIAAATAAATPPPPQPSRPCHFHAPDSNCKCPCQAKLRYVFADAMAGMEEAKLVTRLQHSLEAAIGPTCGVVFSFEVAGVRNCQ